MSQVRFVTSLPKPDPSRGVPVETPSFGAGVATATARGIHVTWDRLRLPGPRRGVGSLDVRIGVDAEGTWRPGAAEVRYANGTEIETFLKPSVEDGLAPFMRGECLAAGAEMLVARPAETLASLRAVSSALDDETLSGALERVVERLDTDPRLRSVAEAAEAADPDRRVREEIEDLARSLRSAALVA